MQELTDEDLFVLGVQDFLCKRSGSNKSEPIDTSGTYEEFHERMTNQRDAILLSRSQNTDDCYKIKGTNREEILKELIDLQQKIRKQQEVQMTTDQIVYTNQAVMTREEIYSKMKAAYDSGVSWCSEQKMPESHIHRLKNDTYIVRWDDLCKYYWIDGLEDEF